MNGLKTAGRVTSSGVFKLSIILFAALLPIVLIFGTPNKIKATLKGSGIYNSVVDKALDSAVKNASPDNTLPIDQPEIRAAIKQAIPPAQIQLWVEQLIDGMYGWLDSNQANPTFKLDLAQTKQNVATALGDYAVQRAKGLPVCTIPQLRALQASGSKIDAFQASCIPQGFDINSLRGTVLNEINNNKDFLNKTTISAEDFPKNNQGKTVFETATQARTAYKWTKLAPYILAGLALVAAISLILLHDKRRRGVFVVGRTLLGAGIFITVSAVVVRYLISQVSSPAGVIVKQVQGDFQTTIIYVVRNLGNSTNNIYLTTGLIFLAAGGIILLLVRLTRPKVEDTPTPEAPANTETNSEPESDKAKERKDDKSEASA